MSLKLAMTFNIFDVGEASGEGQKIGQMLLGMAGEQGLLTLREKSYTNRAGEDGERPRRPHHCRPHPTAC